MLFCSFQEFLINCQGHTFFFLLHFRVVYSAYGLKQLKKQRGAAATANKEIRLLFRVGGSPSHATPLLASKPSVYPSTIFF